MEKNQTGKIITFYSYKGGTGRTMALANVACLLARRQLSAEGGRGVLMIDWDLEAPGLHRYFRPHLRSRFSSHGHAEDPVAQERGLIDLFYDLRDATDKISRHRGGRTYVPSEEDEHVGGDPNLPDSDELARMTLEMVRPEDYVIQTTIPALHLLKAGRFDPDDPEKYAARVNTFNWEGLFARTPRLFNAFAERLAEKYSYVLIDSRTGVTDISGICTMILPEKLVVVFTPNLQSLRGGTELIKRAAGYRRSSHDVRPLVCFPLVSRVETTVERLRHDWRVGAPDDDVIGYEPAFESLFEEVYGVESVNLTSYFDEMLIPHVPEYAYGENIPVLSESSTDKFSTHRAYETFTQKLISADTPWEASREGAGDAIKRRDQPLGRAAAFAYRVRHLNPVPLITAFVPIVAALVLLTLYMGGRISLLDSQYKSLEGRANEMETLRALAEQKLAEAQEPLKAIQKLRDERDQTLVQLQEAISQRDDAVEDLQAAQTDARRARRESDQTRARLNQCLAELPK